VLELPGGIGTVRNAGEEPFMIAQDLLPQEYMTGMRQLSQNKLFTSLYDTVVIYFKYRKY